MGFIDQLHDSSHEFYALDEATDYHRRTIQRGASSFQVLIPKHLPEHELHAVKQQSGTLVIFARLAEQSESAHPEGAAGLLLVAQQLKPSTFRTFLVHELYPETLAAIPATPEWQLESPETT